MKPIYLVILAVVVLAGGLFLWNQSMSETDLVPAADPDTEMMAPEAGMTVPEDMSVTVIPLMEQNNLGQSGTATISEDASGMAVVSLSMTGGEFPDPQPAHIHMGSCPNPGAIEYPLTNVVNGMSETTLDVSYAELTSATEPLALNVHKSAAEASTYTACGDLN